MPYISQIEAYNPHNDEQTQNKRAILDFIELMKDKSLYRSSEIAHITSSGFILNRDMTKTLMVHHNIYNTWAWTGGHADGDRDLLEIAVKEAIEETGVRRIRPMSEEIVSMDILPVFAHMKNGKYVNTHLHLSVAYILIADEGDELVIKKEENSGVMWIDTDRIDAFCNEPDMVLLYKRLCTDARALVQ